MTTFVSRFTNSKATSYQPHYLKMRAIRNAVEWHAGRMLSYMAALCLTGVFTGAAMNSKTAMLIGALPGLVGMCALLAYAHMSRLGARSTRLDLEECAAAHKAFDACGLLALALCFWCFGAIHTIGV